ncbi:MAG: hydroxymethylbilane synthase, partial [Alphaproteobacteria bacterium]
MNGIRIGTRGSPLALAQARQVAALLVSAHGDLATPEIVVIKTTGDKILNRTLAAVGGKGLFTKELEEALAALRVDIAVHSMKDVPTWVPDGLALDCILAREDPRDVLFVGPDVVADSLKSLPEKAVLGTASLRRAAQALAVRPDLRVTPIRGNVGTRMAKLAAGEVDATVLALAGLRRLGLGDQARIILSPEEMLPAVAQGAIGIERRDGDDRIADLLAALHDDASAARVAAERALLAELDGSCRTPIAALAEITDER